MSEIKEKQGAEGTLWLELWKALLGSIGSTWQKKPILLSAGYLLTRNWGVGQSKTSFVQNIRSFFNSPFNQSLDIPDCDVLLFHSSIKPSIQEPIWELAERLNRQGLVCGILSSTQFQILSHKGAFISIEDFETRLNTSRSKISALYLLPVALLDTISFWTQLLLNKDKGLLCLFKHPGEIIYQFLKSRHRLSIADEILDKANPNLIITMQERLPVISELLIKAKERGLKTILYHYELPLIVSKPILSDEVWVWNQTAANDLKRYLEGVSLPRFSIIGNPEIDLALRDSEPSSEFNQLERQTGNRPVFLYLSQFGPLKEQFVKAPFEAMEWMKRAAEQYPEWRFIIKTRPFHHKKIEPGAENLKDFPNILIAREGISFKEFLNWENVRIVAGMYSTGLCVARGMGKDVFRFLVPHSNIPHPIIDEVGIPIFSKQELIKQIKLSSLRKEQKDADDDLFPYKDESFERMENLCLEQIRSYR